jgi:GNAT superfamily N-acetyltransferase
MMPEPIIIEAFTSHRLHDTTQLLKHGFPWLRYLPLGHLSLYFYLFKQRYPLVGLSRCLGVEETRFWVAVSATSQQVLGIVGLYSKTVDAHESYWLDWFCVAPGARGQGIGTLLLQFSLAQARLAGKQFLRIITSDDPNENLAQTLYEKHDFYLIPTSQPWHWRQFNIRMLYRECNVNR